MQKDDERVGWKRKKNAMHIQYEDFNPIDVDNDLLKLFVPYYLTGPTINFEPSRKNTNALRTIVDVDEPNFLWAISSNEEASLSIYCVEQEVLNGGRVNVEGLLDKDLAVPLLSTVQVSVHEPTKRNINYTPQ
ncbi:hypothetical protein V1478_008604 [Vespula squamosa]|uniref:Uncharacterized protein n=1 Tax=Vespula squamosa TaxID=30214 RepID=A0ABD2AU15_VESSQ